MQDESNTSLGILNSDTLSNLSSVLSETSISFDKSNFNELQALESINKTNTDGSKCIMTNTLELTHNPLNFQEEIDNISNNEIELNDSDLEELNMGNDTSFESGDETITSKRNIEAISNQMHQAYANQDFNHDVENQKSFYMEASKILNDSSHFLQGQTDNFPNSKQIINNDFDWHAANGSYHFAENDERILNDVSSNSIFPVKNVFSIHHSHEQNITSFFRQGSEGMGALENNKSGNHAHRVCILYDTSLQNATCKPNLGMGDIQTPLGGPQPLYISDSSPFCNTFPTDLLKSPNKEYNANVVDGEKPISFKHAKFQDMPLDETNKFLDFSMPNGNEEFALKAGKISTPLGNIRLKLKDKRQPVVCPNELTFGGSFNNQASSFITTELARKLYRISDEICFAPCQLNSKSRSLAQITNLSEDCTIHIEALSINVGPDTYNPFSLEPISQYSLLPGLTRFLKVLFHPNRPGSYAATLHFTLTAISIEDVRKIYETRHAIPIIATCEIPNMLINGDKDLQTIDLGFKFIDDCLNTTFPITLHNTNSFTLPLTIHICAQPSNSSLRFTFIKFTNTNKALNDQVASSIFNELEPNSSYKIDMRIFIFTGQKAYLNCTDISGELDIKVGEVTIKKIKINAKILPFNLLIHDRHDNQFKAYHSSTIIQFDPMGTTLFRVIKSHQYENFLDYKPQDILYLTSKPSHFAFQYRLKDVWIPCNQTNNYNDEESHQFILPFNQTDLYSMDVRIYLKNDKINAFANSSSSVLRLTLIHDELDQLLYSVPIVKATIKSQPSTHSEKLPLSRAEDKVLNTAANIETSLVLRKSKSSFIAKQTASKIIQTMDNNTTPTPLSSNESTPGISENNQETSSPSTAQSQKFSNSLGLNKSLSLVKLNLSSVQPTKEKSFPQKFNTVDNNKTLGSTHLLNNASHPFHFNQSCLIWDIRQTFKVSEIRDATLFKTLELIFDLGDHHNIQNNNINKDSNIMSDKINKTAINDELDITATLICDGCYGEGSNLSSNSNNDSSPDYVTYKRITSANPFRFATKSSHPPPTTQNNELTFNNHKDQIKFRIRPGRIFKIPLIFRPFLTRVLYTGKINFQYSDMGRNQQQTSIPLYGCIGRSIISCALDQEHPEIYESPDSKRNIANVLINITNSGNISAFLNLCLPQNNDLFTFQISDTNLYLAPRQSKHSMVSIIPKEKNSRSHLTRLESFSFQLKVISMENLYRIRLKRLIAKYPTTLANLKDFSDFNALTNMLDSNSCSYTDSLPTDYGAYIEDIREQLPHALDYSIFRITKNLEKLKIFKVGGRKTPCVEGRFSRTAITTPNSNFETEREKNNMFYLYPDYIQFCNLIPGELTETQVTLSLNDYYNVANSSIHINPACPLSISLNVPSFDTANSKYTSQRLPASDINIFNCYENKHLISPSEKEDKNHVVNIHVECRLKQSDFTALNHMILLESAKPTLKKHISQSCYLILHQNWRVSVKQLFESCDKILQLQARMVVTWDPRNRRYTLPDTKNLQNINASFVSHKNVAPTQSKMSEPSTSDINQNTSKIISLKVQGKEKCMTKELLPNYSQYISVDPAILTFNLSYLSANSHTNKNLRNLIKKLRIKNYHKFQTIDLNILGPFPSSFYPQQLNSSSKDINHAEKLQNEFANLNPVSPLLGVFHVKRSHQSISLRSCKYVKLPISFTPEHKFFTPQTSGCNLIYENKIYLTDRHGHIIKTVILRAIRATI